MISTEGCAACSMTIEGCAAYSMTIEGYAACSMTIEGSAACSMTIEGSAASSIVTIENVLVFSCEALFCGCVKQLITSCSNIAIML